MKTLKNLLLLISSLLASSGIYYFFPERKLPKDIVIDSMIVYKSEHILKAYSNDSLIKTYKISIGRNAVGPKKFQGDQKTPEGEYYIFSKNPNSGYHKNLGISYPNDNDRARAQQLGKPTGGDIKIHGLKNGHASIGKFHRWRDWTNGCIALTDEEIDELYNAVIIGCKIIIYP